METENRSGKAQRSEMKPVPTELTTKLMDAVEVQTDGHGIEMSIDDLAKSSGVDAGAVGVGISEALITTAAGLVIALGAVIPYSYFTSVSDQTELDIEEASAEILDLLATEVSAEQANA